MDDRDAVVRALASRIVQLEEAIWWALGENGEFKDRPEGRGAFWWRTELRRRSLLPLRNSDSACVSQEKS